MICHALARVVVLVATLAAAFVMGCSSSPTMADAGAAEVAPADSKSDVSELPEVAGDAGDEGGHPDSAVALDAGGDAGLEADASDAGDSGAACVPPEAGHGLCLEPEGSATLTVTPCPNGAGAICTYSENTDGGATLQLYGCVLANCSRCVQACSDGGAS